MYRPCGSLRRRHYTFAYGLHSCRSALATPGLDGSPAYTVVVHAQRTRTLLPSNLDLQGQGCSRCPKAYARCHAAFLGRWCRTQNYRRLRSSFFWSELRASRRFTILEQTTLDRSDMFCRLASLVLIAAVASTACHSATEPPTRSEPLVVTGLVADADTVGLVDIPVAVELRTLGCADALAGASAIVRTNAQGRFIVALERPTMQPMGCVRVTALPPADSFWTPTTAEQDSVVLRDGSAGADSVRRDIVFKEARIAFNFYDHRPDTLGAKAVTVRFHDRSGWRTVAGRDFTTELYATPHSSVFRLRMSDSVRVEVTLADDGMLGQGAITLPVREDWIWSVAVHVADRSPLERCLGCMGARSFPLRSDAPADSLFLVWGGNSISRPVIY